MTYRRSVSWQSLGVGQHKIASRDWARGLLTKVVGLPMDVYPKISDLNHQCPSRYGFICTIKYTNFSTSMFQVHKIFYLDNSLFGFQSSSTVMQSNTFYVFILPLPAASGSSILGEVTPLPLHQPACTNIEMCNRPTSLPTHTQTQKEGNKRSTYTIHLDWYINLE